MYNILLTIAAIYTALYVGLKFKTAIFGLLSRVLGTKYEYTFGDKEYSLHLPPLEGWQRYVIYTLSYLAFVGWLVVCILYW